MRKTSRLDTNSDLLCLDWIQWRIWRLSYRKPRWLRLESFDFGWPGREAPQIERWSGQWQACNGSNHGHLISERSFRYNWPWNVDPSTLESSLPSSPNVVTRSLVCISSATNACKKRPPLEATELAMKFQNIASLHWNCLSTEMWTPLQGLRIELCKALMEMEARHSETKLKKFTS